MNLKDGHIADLHRVMHCYRRYSLAALLGLLPFVQFAQTHGHKAQQDSLRAVIADRKVRLAVADSAGPVEEAVRLRMELARVVPTKEAFMFHAQAVHLADSAGLMTTELEARQGLTDWYVGRGQFKQAYEEAQRIADKGAGWMAEQAEVSGARADAIMRTAQARQDSLLAVMHHAQGEADARLKATEGKALGWMWTALALLVVALAGWWLLLRSYKRVLRGQQAAIDTLQKEVAALKKGPTTKVPATPRPLAPIAVAGPDAEVLAVFRLRGADRLVTLKDAMQRGDHDKVMRVVHTLKPQLTALDADRFGPLCAVITQGPSEDPTAWKAAVERFAAAVGTLLNAPQ